MPFFLLPRGRRPSGGADSSSWLERQVWYAWTFRLQPKAELPAYRGSQEILLRIECDGAGRTTDSWPWTRTKTTDMAHRPAVDRELYESWFSRLAELCVGCWRMRHATLSLSVGDQHICCQNAHIG